MQKLMLVALNIVFIFYTQARAEVKNGDVARDFQIKSGMLKIENDDPDCKEIDLNKSPDSPFWKIPIYDQDGARTCFAYASAQLIDFYKIKNGDKPSELINPTYLAWLANLRSGEGQAFSVSASIKNTIENAKEHGVCGDREVKARISILTDSAKISEPQLLAMLDEIYEKQTGFVNRLFERNKWDKMKVAMSKSPALSVSCEQTDALKRKLESYNLYGISSMEIIKNLFKNCKVQKISLPQTKYVGSGDDANIMASTKNALLKGYPSVLTMCTSSFKDETADSISRDGKRNPKESCRPHAVLATGRAKISGSCSVLVRNSWGTAWKPKAAQACACIDRSGHYKAICDSREAREIVGCWFDESKLAHNTKGVTTFE